MFRKISIEELQQLPLILTREDWDSFRLYEKFRTVCTICSKEFPTKKKFPELNSEVFWCSICKRRQHNLQKYEVDEVRKLKSVQEKQKQTCANRSEAEKKAYHEKLSKIRNSFSEEKKAEIAKKSSVTQKNKSQPEKEKTKQKRAETCKKLYGNPNFRNREKDGKKFFVEIKGDYFFENDKMINPYDRSQDAVYEAKYQCALANGVVFWKQSDVTFAINYIQHRYGKGYLRSFKNA